jgi:hypothetical protein
MGRFLSFHACHKLIHQVFKGQALTLASRTQANVTGSASKARLESALTEAWLPVAIFHTTFREGKTRTAIAAYSTAHTPARAGRGCDSLVG